MGLERNKALSGAVLIAHIVKIARMVLIPAILPAHVILRPDRLERPNDLELLVANCIRFKPRRRLHRDQAQKLHQMVLHHVAHRARAVIVFAPPCDPDSFGHCHLNVVDVLAVPERLKQHIPEPDGHEVLNGLFAKIMINSVNLAFIKMPRQGRVQGFGACQITAKRFFNNDTGFFSRQPVFVQAFGEILKEARSDRKVKRTSCTTPAQRLEGFPPLSAACIQCHIIKPRNKCFIVRGFGALNASKFLKCL